MKAKPIFTVGLAKEYNQVITSKDIHIIQSNLSERFPDYNVLVYLQNTSNDIKFEVFNVQDVKPIDIEEMKAIINEKINK